MLISRDTTKVGGSCRLLYAHPPSTRTLVVRPGASAGGHERSIYPKKVSSYFCQIMIVWFENDKVALEETELLRIPEVEASPKRSASAAAARRAASGTRRPA